MRLRLGGEEQGKSKREKVKRMVSGWARPVFFDGVWVSGGGALLDEPAVAPEVLPQFQEGRREPALLDCSFAT